MLSGKYAVCTVKLQSFPTITHGNKIENMQLLVLFLFDQQSKDRRNIFGEYIKQTAHISVVFFFLLIKRFYAYEENLSVLTV